MKKIIAGVDEVGRGSLVGPVLAAAVIFRNNVDKEKFKDSKQLSKLLKNKPAKVNLIPFNPFPGVKFKPTDQNKINDFRNILLESGIMTTTRKTRGDDIQAACGQLSGQVMNLAKKTLRQKLKKTLH